MSMLEDFLEEIQAEQYIQKQVLPKIKKLIKSYHKDILKIRVEVDSEKEDILSKLFVYVEPEASQLTLLQKDEDEDEGEFEYLLYYHYATKQYVYVQIFQKSSIIAYIYIIPESLIQ